MTTGEKATGGRWHGLRLITDSDYGSSSEELSPVGGRLRDWIHGIWGSPGIVVDEEMAKKTPCTCYRTPEGKDLCFSKAIMGMLDQAQVAKYCPEKTYKPGIPVRVEKMREATKVCQGEIKDIPKTEGERRMITWIRCMSTHLKGD